MPYATASTPSKKSHSHILEGCLCAFLDHFDSSFSLAVLTDPQPPTAPRSAGYVGPRLRDRDASSPARGAVFDLHPQQRDDFHKYPSDIH